MRAWLIAGGGGGILALGFWVNSLPPSAPPARATPTPSVAPVAAREELIREAKEFDLPPPPAPNADVKEMRDYQARLTEIIMGTDPAAKEKLATLRAYKEEARKVMARKHRDASEKAREDKKAARKERQAAHREEHPIPERDPQHPPLPRELRVIGDDPRMAPPPSESPSPSPSPS